MKVSVRYTLDELPLSMLPIMLAALLGYALHALLSTETPSGNHDILLVVVTTVANKLATIVDWRFGGSKKAPEPPTGGPDTMTLGPGEQATATPTAGGTTTIEKDTP